jgi:peptidoglycan/xylan/chitin deacetylase (PgdA/CDA1 family)
MLPGGYGALRALDPVTAEMRWEFRYLKPSMGGTLSITFDDGGRSALYIAEALSERGWVGHFFIVTDRVGSTGFLRAREIRVIRELGHVVGSHSHTHPDIFRDQPLGKMLSEWYVSADFLTQLLGERCLAASVPGGHISPVVLRSAALSGFKFLFTCEPVLTPSEVTGCHVLGRYLVKTHTPLMRLRDLAEFRGWGSARVARLVKNAIRRTVPSLYRQYVSRQTREWPQPILPASAVRTDPIGR